MPSFLANHRVVVGEIMDSPDIDPADHLSALAGLRRINAISGVVRQMARPIRRMAMQVGLKRITLLDIACGGGDVPIGVARTLKHHGFEVHCTLLDQSATAIAQATAAASAAGIACTGVQGNALGARSLPRVDAVTNSLFLHHLHDAAEVTDLLRSMQRVARRMVVVSDLRRSRGGFLAAWIGCRILSRSPIVHFDGPASVRAAWTEDELAGFAGKAGMMDAHIRRCLPWRMLLTWNRLQEAEDEVSDESQSPREPRPS
jgi:2-polyprenyl-3-methyl-5-hydroxy-6-metoxy-1,4-benzoquinol methylase